MMLRRIVFTQRNSGWSTLACLLRNGIECEVFSAVSGEETRVLRLERMGAHHCRKRKFASDRIGHPRAKGFELRARLRMWSHE